MVTRVRYGAVEAHPDGSVTATSGCCSTRRGHATSFAQVVASELGVDRRRVRLVEANTAVELLTSNLCRCTGYESIRRAVGRGL